MPFQTHISSSQLTVTINSTGAEICSILNKANTEFIWQANPAVWARHAPVLFPIVGKLKNNAFLYKGKSYELGQHGFARDCEFELVENNGSSCVFALKADEASKAHYPFEFIFRIRYDVNDVTVITQYEIINPSQEELWFSVGAHPAFNCPLSPGEETEDYYLEFETSSHVLTQLSNGLRSDGKEELKLNERRLLISPHLFDKDALVFENGQIDAVSLCSSKSKSKITMRCKGWPYFGIWSKPAQPFVCLEPWYGIADALSSTQELTEKDGIIRLNAKDSFACTFSIHFDF